VPSRAYLTSMTQNSDTIDQLLRTIARVALL